MDRSVRSVSTRQHLGISKWNRFLSSLVSLGYLKCHALRYFFHDHDKLAPFRLPVRPPLDRDHFADHSSGLICDMPTDPF